MSSNEETRIALGVLAAIVVVSLFFVLALQFAGGTESSRKNSAQASRMKSEPPRTSKTVAVTRSSRPVESQPQPVAVAAQAASAPASASSTPTSTSVSASLAASLSTSLSTSQLANADTQLVPEAPVIDPVPLAFFNSTATTSELPSVIEKYRDRVARGELFMARLEAIVTDNAPAFSDDRQNLSMEFTARSQSKRLSFKSVHVTEWIEATFNSAVSSATRDVLVDVRRVDDSGAEGERVALFFASVQEHADKRGFAMNADIGDNDSILRVYAVNDELHQLGKVRLTPADISD
ncbi:MAG: hypothetical protein KTR32_43380 [Granulosicoccus sp.]|nr:hypothetical protein [Granulosicoccus sp.]